MRLGVDRFLADEPLDVEAHLVILDQRQGVLEHLDEELLTSRKQQMQDIEHVGGQGLARHIVKRQLRPVEMHVASLQQ